MATVKRLFTLGELQVRLDKDILASGVYQGTNRSRNGAVKALQSPPPMVARLISTESIQHVYLSWSF